MVVDIVSRHWESIILMSPDDDGVSNHRQFDCLFIILFQWKNIMGVFICLILLRKVHYFIEARRRIYASLNWDIIGSSYALSPIRRQAGTNDDLLSIRPSGTNFSEILIGIQIFPMKKMHLSTNLRSSCLGLNVLMQKAFHAMPI